MIIYVDGIIMAICGFVIAIMCYLGSSCEDRILKITGIFMIVVGVLGLLATFNILKP